MSHRTRYCLRGIALAAAFAFAACSKNTTPTTPNAPADITDTFSSTIAQQTSVTHQFTVNATGEVTILLTSVSPLSTMAIGVGLMTSDGTNCVSTSVHNDNARANNVAALAGTAVAGNYCVRVYDSGNVPPATTVTYIVTVEHP